MFPRLFILFLILSVKTVAQGQSWQLDWSDEFDGTSLNTCYWTIETGNGQGGWGTGQVDFATNRPENVRVENGNLILEVHKESDYWGQNYWGNWEQWDYTSGRIITRDKIIYKYGKIEARLKILEGQGIGAAFWMLPQYEAHGGWPKSGEIDIMEINGDNVQRNYGTVHYEQWGTHQYNGDDTIVPGNLHTEFHTYAIEWDEQWIIWYLDGAEWHRYPTNVAVDGRLPFQEEFFMIMSVGVGSQFSGSTIDDSVLPTKVVVDYVRVYRQIPSVQSPYSGTPHGVSVKIEAENYDEGGIGVAYSDFSPGNYGNLYRSDGVDIQATTDVGGGYNIGWTDVNEWLEYTIDVAASDYYNIDFRAASATGNKLIQLYSDCEWLGNVNVSNTGGWQSWQTFSLNNVYLQAGIHILKIKFPAGGINFNYFMVGEPPLLAVNTVAEDEIKISPSPFRDQIKIEVPSLSGSSSLNIYNMYGELLFSKEIYADEIILLGENFISGMYIAEIISNERTYIKKIMKE